MSAFIPNRREPEVTERALARVREDKEREAGDGFDGTWVAHPDLVPVAHGGLRPRARRPARTRRTDSARTCRSTRGPAPRRRDPRRADHRGRAAQQRQRRRSSTSTSWLARQRRGGDQRPDGGRRDGGDQPRHSCGSGARHGVTLDDGRPVTAELLRGASSTRSSPSSVAGDGRLSEAAELLDRLVLARRLPRVPDAARVPAAGRRLTMSIRPAAAGR